MQGPKLVDSLDFAGEIARLLDDQKVSRDDAWKMFARLDAQASHASVLFVRRLLAVGLLWAVDVGIAANFVHQGSIGPFELRDLVPVLIVSPLLLAFVYHDLIVAVCLGTVAAEQLKSCTRYLFPGISDRQNSLVTVSMDFTELESLFADRTYGWFQAMLRWPGIVLGAVLLFGPAFATAHSGWLAVSSADGHIALATISAVTGIVIAARAVIMAVLVVIVGKAA